MAGKLSFSIAVNLLTENFKKGVNTVKNQLSNFKKFLGNVFVGFGVLQLTKDIAAVGGAFEGAMARVKSVSKAGRAEFKAMRQEAILLGATTKYTASQAAEAMEILVRNGFKARQAIEATSGVLQLAQSQSISLAESAEIATRAINGFGLEVKDLGRVNDIMAASASNSAANVLEFGEALKTAAPVARVLGISMEETMTVLAQLAQRGIKGEDAGTAVKQILMRLSSQTPKAAAALKKYGLEISETTLRTKGLLATLEEMRLSGIGNSLKDIEAFAGKFAAPKFAAALTGPMDELYKSIADSEGEAARMFGESLGEFEKAKFELKSIYENSQVKVFSGLKGLFTEPLKFLTEFIRRIQDLPTIIAGVATIAGVKILSTFANIKRGLRDTVTSSMSKEWANRKNAVNDVNIASHFNKTVNSFGKNDAGYFTKLNNALKNTSTQFNRATKGGSEYAKVLRHIHILSSTAPGTKKHEKSLAFFNQYKQQVNELVTTDKGAAAARLATFENEMRGKVRSATTNGNVIKSAFTSVGNGIKSFGKGLYSMMGGWVGIIMTLVGVIGTYLVSAYRNSTKMAREFNATHKEAIQKNAELDTTFRNLVDVLRKNEKSTTQYKAALSVLKREYPELLDKLKLEKVSVNNSAEEWKNYKGRIDDAIEAQKKFNLAKMKIEAQQKLVSSISEDSGMKRINENLKLVFNKSGIYDENEATIFTQGISGALSSLIVSELDDSVKRSKIKETLESYLKSLNVGWELVEYNSAGIYTAGKENVNYVDRMVDIAMATANKVTPLLNSLNHIKTDDATPPKTGDEVINDFLTQQHDSFKLQRENIQQEGDLKKKSAEAIQEDVASMAKVKLDDITKYAVENFKGYKDKKGNEIDVKQFIQGNSGYQEILSSSLYTKGTEGEKDTPLQKAEKRYAKSLEELNAKRKVEEMSLNEYNKALDELNKATYIQLSGTKDKAVLNSSFYKERKQDADNPKYNKGVAKFEEVKKEYDTNAAVLEKKKNLGYITDENYEKAVRELILKTLVAVQILEGIGQEGEKFVSDLKEKYQSPKIEPKKRDSVFDYKKTDLEIKKEELKIYEEYRDQLKKAIDEGATELEDQLNAALDNVKSLGEAVKIAEVKQDLKELRRELNEGIYSGMKDIASSSDRVVSAFGNLKDVMNDMDATGWERIMAVWNAMTTTIDSFLSIIKLIESMTELTKKLSDAKKEEAEIDNQATAQKVTNASTGMAADLAAADVKQATATTEVAANTSAAASEAGKGAAKLPFPANLIAISAAIGGVLALFAAIPKFANGGIVGGGSYSGDNVLARVNSGEMILNQSQQSKLFGMLNSGQMKAADAPSSAEVKLRISGTDLVGVIRNVEKRKSKLR